MLLKRSILSDDQVNFRCQTLFLPMRKTLVIVFVCAIGELASLSVYAQFQECSVSQGSRLYAYVADGWEGIRVLDVSDALAPFEISHYDTPGEAVDVERVGNYLYVADGPAGLRVLQIQSDGRLQEVGSYSFRGYARRLLVSGRYVYIADRDGVGLRIVDVSDPSNPREVGVEGTPARAEDVVLVDGYAYVSDGFAGVYVIDVRDPSAPVVKNFISTSPYAEGLAVWGRYVYVADYDRVRVLDASDPAAPVEVGAFDTPGKASDISVSAPYIYVAGRHGGVRIIDVSQPATMQEVGQIENVGDVWDISAFDGFAYVVNNTGGVVIVDVSNIYSPLIISTYPEVGGMSIALSSSCKAYAYVADRHGGVRILDIKNPSFVFETGYLENIGNIFDVYVLKNIAYIVDNRGRVVVADVKDPSAPFVISSWTASNWTNFTGVELAEIESRLYAYVADGWEGIRVLDVSDALIPFEISHYDTPGEAVDVERVGNYLYVADGPAGLRVLQIQSDGRLQEVGSYSFRGYARRLLVSGRYVYIADRDGVGLRIVDVSDPSNPREVGVEGTPARAEDVVLVDGYAYVSDGFAGVYVIDVRDPSAPVVKNFISTSPYAEGLAVWGRYVYVADYDRVRVLDASDPAAPVEVGAFDTPGKASDIRVVETNPSPRVLYVKHNAMGANDGSSWHNAYRSLQDALRAARPGDEIWVAAGIYYPDEGSGLNDNDRALSFELKRGVAIYGGFSGTEQRRDDRDWEKNVTILSGDIDQNDLDTDGDGIKETLRGNNAYHVVLVRQADMMAILDGFAVVGGMANGFYPYDHGGGIYVERFSNSKVALRQLKVVGNTARKGGGIFIGDGAEVEAILENIDITGNSASYGGGLYTAPASHSSLYNVRIKQNTALEGGGVFMDGITDWKKGELENNLANEGAGILAGVGGGGTISEIMIVNNVASEEGGGLFLRETQNAAILENVVFWSNDAGYGGAVYVFNSSPSEWRNVTIVENQAHHGGGYYSSGTGYLTFRNSLLVGNKGGDCVGTVNPVSSHNLIQEASNTCNLQDGLNGNQIGRNARLVLKEGAIYQLMIDSPALDAADGSTCPSEDLRGVLRPQDSNGDGIARCDIGALELRVYEQLHPPTAVAPVMPASGSTVYLNWSGGGYALDKMASRVR